MSDSREYTKEEIREMLLKHLAGIAKYWANLPDKTPEERCHGTVFSVLSTLDGCSLAMPGFQLIPFPAEEDNEYHQSEGENWFPYSEEHPNDVGGALHEQYSKYEG